MYLGGRGEESNRLPAVTQRRPWVRLASEGPRGATTRALALPCSLGRWGTPLGQCRHNNPVPSRLVTFPPSY
jgi:hypothetical protein